jgi:hypothetical protein
MSWFNELGSLIQQYSGANPSDGHANAERDFDQVANVAPRDALSGGISEAFRSDQTPPFASMLTQLFGNSNGSQRAALLSTLVSAVGPSVLSSVLSRQGGGGGQLASLLQSKSSFTPEEADQVPPEAVADLAQEAQNQDPSVIDRVSDFYAEHPTLVKSLGAAALAVAMSGLSKQKRGLF